MHARLAASTISKVRNAGGLWSFRGERIVAISEAPGGRPTVLVPSEHVLMLAVDLPIVSRRKRVEALPFAIEDRLADRIEAVHVAMGAELEPRRYLVGIIRHEMMAAWLERLEAAGLGHAALVPDALLLPRPGAGQWLVDLAEGRACVRTGDGIGFALPETQLRTAWIAAGRPTCIAHGAALPPEMMGEGTDTLPERPAESPLDLPLDLRQGGYARRRGGAKGPWRRIGTVAALGLVAHGAIAAADTAALVNIAQKREAEVRALLATAAPGLAPDGDVVAAATDLLPAEGGAAPGRFLPLLARTSAALIPVGGGVAVRRLSYGESEGSLMLDLTEGEGADPDRVKAALAAAGLAATREGDRIMVRQPEGAGR
ncbi:type II secretion system protein GspL [Sphingomonas oleivorans]|uniref:type II secretion system protein GspL n=1 Tax=Sphingomonas oleivorans TaxID=1735121 RepID=UPI0013FE4971|nr:type II secretion system protein GspL [Sphingomonas oleivorans]